MYFSSFNTVHFPVLHRYLQPVTDGKFHSGIFYVLVLHKSTVPNGKQNIIMIMNPKSFDTQIKPHVLKSTITAFRLDTKLPLSNVTTLKEISLYAIYVQWSHPTTT